MRADFCIEIDFQKETENPARIFRAMSELIEAFQGIDKELVKSIDPGIEPVVMIGDIETGSIKTFLIYMLRSLDDLGLKELNWKPLVGNFLVKGKYLILDFMEKNSEISTREQIRELEKELLHSAQETDVIHIPSYTPVDSGKLLPKIGQITSALSHLNKNDKVNYITPENTVKLNPLFNFSPENIEALLTLEIIKTTSEMILKIKKPDYLGDSQWEFRYESRVLLAKILDYKWLKEFQTRHHDVRPGDSIRAVVDVSVRYDFDNEVIGTHYDITEVKNIIQFESHDQIAFFT